VAFLLWFWASCPEQAPGYWPRSGLTGVVLLGCAVGARSRSAPPLAVPDKWSRSRYPSWEVKLWCLPWPAVVAREEDPVQMACVPLLPGWPWRRGGQRSTRRLCFPRLEAGAGTSCGGFPSLIYCGGHGGCLVSEVWCLQRRVRPGASLQRLLAALCPSSCRTQRQ
jgi:hypothetical protein